MSLDAKIVKLLNDFADSQPALRLPNEPWGSSNPKLGDALKSALDVADAENATGVAYTPGVGGNWSPAVTSAQGALDQLAARMVSAEGDITTAQGDIITAQSTAENAASQAYTAGTPGDWDTTPPATIKEALDRIASALAAEIAVPIP